MAKPSTEPFTTNDRSYAPPARPVVVICLDGSADEYLDAALCRGRMPSLRRLSLLRLRRRLYQCLNTFQGMRITAATSRLTLRPRLTSTQFRAILVVLTPIVTEYRVRACPVPLK